MSNVLLLLRRDEVVAHPDRREPVGVDGVLPPRASFVDEYAEAMREDDCIRDGVGQDLQSSGIPDVEA